MARGKRALVTVLRIMLTPEQEIPPHAPALRLLLVTN
jgi:hypothetical protein